MARPAVIFTSNPLFTPMLQALPLAVFVLNTQRQVIFANPLATRFQAGGLDLNPLLMTFPDAFLPCANHSADGCGSGPSCQHCGAYRAVLKSIDGVATEEECRLLVRNPTGESALDLRVCATPLACEGETFTLVTLLDIADEKRRLFLEKTFLHDLGNSIQALKGFMTLLETTEQAQKQKHYLGRVAEVADLLQREMEAYQMLVAAEEGNLAVQFHRVSTHQVLQAVFNTYHRPDMLAGRHLVLELGEDAILESDATLLERVLGNMVKNALEASALRETVTLSCARSGGSVTFRVKNPGEMPETVRLQVFKRSFSTKGSGRGLGTYSMKLLTERYLGGSIRVTSSEAEGTVFSASYPIQAKRNT
jgi:signal transduction histidine kinase